MNNPYEFCPPTDCPICGLPEEAMTRCSKCTHDMVCPNDGCMFCNPLPRPTGTEKWVTFCKRTGDPKLAWIERELDKLRILHRRHKYSFHAPILEVPENRLQEADAILQRRVGRYTIDDIRDDHPRW